MGLWDELTGWMYKPFQEPLDVGNWVLLLLLSTVIAYGWARVLDKILEE